MNELQTAKDELNLNNFTCVLCKNGEMYTSTLRGVKPLVLFYDEGVDLKGCSAADRVVGRATAFLYVLIGAREVYAKVISRPALEVFSLYGIYAEYDILTNNIINRQGDGVCPFELLTSGVSEPHEAYIKIKDKMLELGI